MSVIEGGKLGSDSEREGERRASWSWLRDVIGGMSQASSLSSRSVASNLDEADRGL